jgi:hypothetical protein
MFCRPMVTTLAVSGGHPVTGKLDLDLGAILVAGGRNERDVLHDLRSNRIVIRQAVLDLFYLINLDRSSETQLQTASVIGGRLSGLLLIGGIANS